MHLGRGIVTVARTRAIDYIRSSVGRTSEQSIDLERFESPAAFANPETELVQADRGRRTRESLMKLPANQREALELAYFEGLTQTEIAERMKQPLGTVKTWMRTGIRVLREELGLGHRMTCEELRDDYELYALGTLEGEERDEISRHLARGCDNCTEGVRRASLVNAWIATSAPEVAPPARLRRRVRQIAGVERPRVRFLALGVGGVVRGPDSDRRLPWERSATEFYGTG